ncbi:MAG: hypothetical protein WEB59_14715 [Thermoanaerobaculia bacterium]
MLRRLTLRAGLFLLAAPVLAEVNQWTLLGPYGPEGALPVQAMAISAGAIYAGSGGEVFRSTDGGVHWTSVFHAQSSPVWSLASRPASPRVVYAGTAAGVFRSIDEGNTWAAAGLDAEAVFSLAVNPGGSSTLYAGTFNGTVGGSIFKSADSGATWSRVFTNLPGYVTVLAIDSNEPDTVFAGGISVGILRTRDGGVHWESLTDADLTLGIAIDPADSSLVYAIRVPFCPFPLCSPSRLQRSNDGGDTWFDVTTLPGLFIDAVVVDASSTVYANAGDRVYASRDHGATWSPIEVQTPLSVSVLALDPLEPAKLYAATFGGVYGIQVDPDGPCAVPGFVLCLQGGRFQVTVGWQASPLGPTFPAPAVPVSAASGYFWFFDPDNVEVMVKVLDGTSINGHFWVFYGALSNVQYTVRVTDTRTGETKTYVNPAGTLASVADTQAFPSDVGGAAPAATGPRTFELDLAGFPQSCQPDGVTLCLQDGRFQVETSFQLSPSGPTIQAQAVPLTGDTGYFWFFDDANVELVVKVLDGRPVNGHFWVFYGALSSVEYFITVTDTQTGQVRTYHNDRGNLASVADTSAF